LIAAVMVVRHIVYDTRDEPLEFAEAVYPQGRWASEEEDILRGLSHYPSLRRPDALG
jgi:hypothetical protein